MGNFWKKQGLVDSRSRRTNSHSICHNITHEVTWRVHGIADEEWWVEDHVLRESVRKWRDPSLAHLWQTALGNQSLHKTCMTPSQGGPAQVTPKKAPALKVSPTFSIITPDNKLWWVQTSSKQWRFLRLALLVDCGRDGRMNLHYKIQ